MRAATQFSSAPHPRPRLHPKHTYTLGWSQPGVQKAGSLADAAVYTSVLRTGSGWDWLRLKPRSCLCLLLPSSPYRLVLWAPPIKHMDKNPPFSALLLLLGTLTQDSFAVVISPSSAPKGSAFCFTVFLEKLDIWLQLIEKPDKQ